MKVYLIIILGAFSLSCMQSPLTEGNSSDRSQEIPISETSDLNQAAYKLFELSNPALPENKDMPNLMKERLSWVHTRFQSNQLVLVSTDSYIDGKKKLLMFSSYDGDLPLIGTSNRSLFDVLQKLKTEPNARALIQNNYNINLTHEAIHHERAKEFFKANRSYQENFNEEIRVWIKNNLEVIRPMIATNQPIPQFFIDFDKILLSCSDKPCPAVESYLRGIGYTRR